VSVESYLPLGEFDLTILKEWMLASALEEERLIHREETAFDESVVLLSRGKLWRVNPRSARGMKQGPKAVRGVSRYEVEKA
jgi:hypothetical protein